MKILKINSPYALISIASILWGAGYFIRKIVLFEVTPVTLTIVTLFICAIVSFFDPSVSSKTLRKLIKYPLLSVSIAATGVLFGTLAMFYGLEKIDVSLATLLERLQLPFTVLLGFMFFKEHLGSANKWLVVLAFIASLTLLWSQGAAINTGSVDLDILGSLSVLLAAFSWALATFVGKKMSAIFAPGEIAFIRFSLGAALIFPIALVSGDVVRVTEIGTQNFIWIIVTAIGATSVGYRLYYSGLKSVPASNAATVELLTPVTAVVLGVIFLGEHFTPIGILAAITLLVSILMLSFRRGKIER